MSGQTFPSVPPMSAPYTIARAADPETGEIGWQAKWLNVRRSHRPTCMSPDASPVFTERKGGKASVRRHMAFVYADAVEGRAEG
jgi:hypothetical protein